MSGQLFKDWAVPPSPGSIFRGMSPKSTKVQPSSTTTSDTVAAVSTPESPLVRKRRQQDELRARAGGTLLSDASGGETLG